jgi:hypothetical protein
MSEGDEEYLHGPELLRLTPTSSGAGRPDGDLELWLGLVARMRILLLFLSRGLPGSSAVADH